MYHVRRVNIGKSPQLDELAHECGLLYSKTCPACGHKRKSKPQGRVFHCTNKKCRFTWHRDGVGACNIRRKYLDLGPVVGVMAPPTGMRFNPHIRVAQREKVYR